MRNLIARILCNTFICILFITIPKGLIAGQMTEQGQNITSIINEIIEASGGKENIESMHSLQAKGEIEAFMLHDQGTYILYFKQGRKLRVETRYKHSSELRILNGDKGYRSNDGIPFEEVYGPRYFAMVYQYKHIDILNGLITRIYQISYEGVSSINGNDVDVLKLNDKEGTAMDIYIGKKNSLILKVTGYFSEGSKKMNLSSEFSDFRKVHGVVLPFKITNYAEGLKIGQTVINKYILNPDIADSLFQPFVMQ
jgi:outer membrane lipoprotein-sorting protein